VQILKERAGEEREEKQTEVVALLLPSTVTGRRPSVHTAIENAFALSTKKEARKEKVREAAFLSFLCEPLDRLQSSINQSRSQPRTVLPVGNPLVCLQQPPCRDCLSPNRIEEVEKD
jgi:hypothetical protein